MSVRVVAKKVDDDNYSVELRSAYFGKEAMSADELAATDGDANVRSKVMRAPQFPPGAASVGARGVAYLIVKIGPDGKVMDAFVEKVNLQVLAREEEMAMLRNQFGKSALRTGKSWTFEVPKTGELADDPYWLVRVPVNYQYQGQKTAGYGEWDVYIPGPVSQAPWAGEQGQSDPDAMLAGGVYPLGRGLRLLTPLQSG